MFVCIYVYSHGHCSVCMMEYYRTGWDGAQGAITNIILKLHTQACTFTHTHVHVKEPNPLCASVSCVVTNTIGLFACVCVCERRKCVHPCM